MAQMMFNVSSAPEPFEFERLVDKSNRLQWLERNWHHSIYWSILYLVIIFSLKKLMRNLQPLQLNTPLIIWNLGLAIFSIGGTVRMFPGFIYNLKEYGFTSSVCNFDHGQSIQPTVFWGWLFVASKVIELGDTVFIVLRKRNLIFLHWYHHIMTLMMCWYTTANSVAVTQWFGVMNYFVHSLMYSYFTLAAMNIKIPRIIAMFITSLQLVQMIVGSFVCSWAIKTKWQGQPCHFPANAVAVALGVYLTYVLLFARLFYLSYIAKSHKSKKSKAE